MVKCQKCKKTKKLKDMKFYKVKGLPDVCKGCYKKTVIGSFTVSIK
jgi:hypothetical protein